MKRTVALALLVLVGCTSSPATPRVSPPTSAAASPSAAAPRIALAPQALLGARFLAPARWRRHVSTSVDPGNGHTDGYVTYAGPHGSLVVVDVNTCAPCADQGLVTSGRANGVPDPLRVADTFPRASGAHQLSSTSAVFTGHPMGAGYPAIGLVVVSASGGAIHGFVVMEVALPPGQRTVADVILRSLSVSPQLG